MTGEELREIHERAERATPGPWVRSTKDIFGPELARGWQQLVAEADDFGDAWHNGEFIAHARTDIPALVAHITALEAENARLREIVADVASASDLDRYMVCPWGCTHDGRGEGPHTADCPVTKARALANHQ